MLTSLGEDWAAFKPGLGSRRRVSENIRIKINSRREQAGTNSTGN
jgi:hypothetical protein